MQSWQESVTILSKRFESGIYGLNGSRRGKLQSRLISVYPSMVIGESVAEDLEVSKIQAKA